MEPSPVEPTHEAEELPEAPFVDGEPSLLEGGLDPVDLALLMRAHQSARRKPASRYLPLVVVVVLFVILMGVGIWLASHVHAHRNRHERHDGIACAPPGASARRGAPALSSTQPTARAGPAWRPHATVPPTGRAD